MPQIPNAPRLVQLEGLNEVMGMRWKRCSVLAVRPVRASATAGENSGFSDAQRAFRVFREAGCASERDSWGWGAQRPVVKKDAGSADLEWSASGRKEKWHIFRKTQFSLASQKEMRLWTQEKRVEEETMPLNSMTLSRVVPLLSLGKTAWDVWS